MKLTIETMYEDGKNIGYLVTLDGRLGRDFGLTECREPKGEPFSPEWQWGAACYHARTDDRREPRVQISRYPRVVRGVSVRCLSGTRVPGRPAEGLTNAKNSPGGAVGPQE